MENGTIEAGKGLEKGRKLEGDMILKGIVGENFYNIKENIGALGKVKESEIRKIAIKALDIIYYSIKNI